MPSPLSDFNILPQSITFGPWVTEHFRTTADDRFEARFIDAVRSHVLPLLTGPVLSMTGEVFSQYDKPNHVGPYSVVKHHYDYVLTFESAAEKETVFGSFTYQKRDGASIDLSDPRIDNAASREREPEEEMKRIEIMITPKADAYLRNSKFNPAAGIISNYMPLTMLYWEDELTEEVTETWGDADKFGIYILLRVRCQLWKGRQPEPGHMKIWNQCLVTYLECPIFKRITVPQSVIDDQLALENETFGFLEESGYEPVNDEGKK